VVRFKVGLQEDGPTKCEYNKFYRESPSRVDLFRIARAIAKREGSLFDHMGHSADNYQCPPSRKDHHHGWETSAANGRHAMLSTLLLFYSLG